MYGQEEVSALAERLKVDQRKAVRAFREYRECGAKVVPSDLQPLLLAINTIPVSTADCERGYSQMNLIMTATRNSLAVRTAWCLLFGKLVGPPLSLFNPLPYVRSWLAAGKQSADDTNSKRAQKDQLESHKLFDVLNQSPAGDILICHT